MNTERIQKVIQTEATTPSIGDFLLTHVPFENLFLDEGYKNYLSENKLLELMLAKPEEHKFILVQGGNGSGKSHLIRWLKEKYVAIVDKEKEATLLISRAHNTLQDALTQLLESDIFPSEIKENELKAIKNAKSNITGEELKRTINFNFTLEVQADKNNNAAILELRYRDWLVEFLNNPFIQNEFLLIDNGPLDRIRSKIETVRQGSVASGDDPMFTADDFAITIQQIMKSLNRSDGRAASNVISLAEKFADPRIGADLRRRTADYLNTKVSGVVSRSMKLQSADFKKLFIALRKTLRAQGMSLALFVEDINSFTGIDEALMEVLLTDHAAEGNHDYCRITSVVGSTTAFYRDKLNESIKERIKSNIYLAEKSVLGTKEQLEKFAAKYINAINLSGEQVATWLSQGASDSVYPVFKPEHDWAAVDCNGNKLSIFPFNSTALWKLYSGMDVPKKTPRVFLKSIISHVLKLWCESKETFLLDENNFINADISMPRWASSLYSNANLAIDTDSAIQRGILLRLWGDGTTNRDGGILGGLTADVFKTFDVYSGINICEKGTPKKTDVDDQPPPPPSPPPPSPPPPSPPSPGVPQVLIDLEIDLDNWLRSNKTLNNHINFRDWLYPFITSGIDWELFGVPQILVNSYINLRGKVFIEGQSTSISDGFLLPRNKESHELLTALAYWRHEGNYSWNFTGGTDHLVIATAWLHRHRQEIVDCVRAPKDKSKTWDLPLWNVASIYAIKTLFGGLDISKSSEELAIELLGKVPTFHVSAMHSKAWQDLKDMIIRNNDYSETLYKETLAYFSKSVGSAQAGDTKYIFVDAFELIAQVNKLKISDFELKGLCPQYVSDRKSTWYHAVNFINLFVVRVNEIVDSEFYEVEKYLSYFNSLLGSNLDESAIVETLAEIKRFLAFLLNTLNLSYSENDFKVLSSSEAKSKLTTALVNAIKLNHRGSTSEMLLRFAQHPFNDIDSFYTAFKKFDALLEEKEHRFGATLDMASKSSIDQYKADFDRMANEMLQKLNSMGGIAK